jgi:hypothetical protein
MEAYAVLEHFADVVHFGTTLAFGYGKVGGSTLPPAFDVNGTEVIDEESEGDDPVTPAGPFDGETCGEVHACTEAGTAARRGTTECSAAGAANDPAVFAGDLEACQTLADERSNFRCDAPGGTRSLRFTVTALRDGWRPSCTNVLHSGPSSTTDEDYACPTSAETCTIPYHRNAALLSRIFARAVDGTPGVTPLGLSRSLAIWGRATAAFGSALDSEDVDIFADYAAALATACAALAESEALVFALPLANDPGGHINTTHCASLDLHLAAAGLLGDEEGGGGGGGSGGDVLLPCGEYRCAGSGGDLGTPTELILITLAATCGVLALGASCLGGLAFFWYKKVWIPDQEQMTEMSLGGAVEAAVDAEEREREREREREKEGEQGKDGEVTRVSRRVSRTGSKSQVRGSMSSSRAVA